MILRGVVGLLVTAMCAFGLATPAQADDIVETPTPKITTRSAANTTITFYWGLKTEERAAAKKLRQVSDPKRRGYRQFLSANKIAKKYGASRTTIRTVTKYARAQGLRPVLDKSRLFMRIRGSVAAFQKAFNVVIVDGDFNGYRVYSPWPIPVLPKKIARHVPNPKWLAQYQLPATRAESVRAFRANKEKAKQHANVRSNRVGHPVNRGTLIGACAKVRKSPLASQMMSVQQVAKAYRFSNIQLPKTRGEARKRPLVGIMSAGSGYSNSVFAQAARCFGISAKPYRVRTDGINHALASGMEGNLDTQIVAATLRGNTRFPVYETSPIGLAPSLGFVAALNSPNRPSVLTYSYGLCESAMQDSFKNVTNSILLRLALAGTSVLAAAGDRGSSGCVNNDTGQGPTGRAVWFPASSPYVTAVGGTRLILNRNNSIRGEVAWNDKAFGYLLGSGGGNSDLFKRPWWQPVRGTGGSKYGRAVPDISGHADIGFPGYPIFLGKLAPSGLAPVGGTSASAPLIASAIGLMNRQQQRAGRPTLGFLNPWLYQSRRAGKSIRDITSGNNDVFGNGCCKALRGYDRTTGLGSPNFQALSRNVRAPR